MPTLTPAEQAALIARADNIIEDTQSFATALAAKLVTTRAADQAIPQPISGPNPVVPDNGPCPHCDKRGVTRFVRGKKAGVAWRDYHCTACDRSWAISEEAFNPDPYRRPPIRLPL
jgi:hypothetical protein